jgi:hypothetical protein
VHILFGGCCPAEVNRQIFCLGWERRHSTKDLFWLGLQRIGQNLRMAVSDEARLGAPTRSLSVCMTIFHYETEVTLSQVWFKRE